MHRTLRPELKVAASATLLQRGCVNVIGLEEIKFEAGPRWEKMRSSIYAHLETLLRQKLGPTDFFFQLDDTSFLVSMPVAAQEESQVFCLRVAHELHTNLLGHCDIGLLRIARATHSDGDVLDLTAVAGEGLFRLAAQAGLQAPPKNAPSPRQASGGNPDPVGRGAAPAHQFVPMWDLQKEAITTYRCETIAGPVAFESRPPAAKFKADLVAALSRVRHATQSLADNLKIGQRFLMTIPISFELLSSPVARMELASVCRNLSSALRPYLVFEIGDLPYGVPQSRISELAGSLRPFCRGVAVQFSAHIPGYSAYQGAGLHAIGLSLAPGHVGIGEADDEVFKLCVAAKRLHVRTFVLDVPSLQTLRTVHGLGVHALSSPAIGPPLNAPAPIRRLSAQDIPGLIRDSEADFARHGERARPDAVWLM
jgi:hypothetical protein